MTKMSVQQSFIDYLESISLARSANTTRTYANALSAFSATLTDRDIDPEYTPISEADENWILPFISDLNIYAPATERLYLTATAGWYEFLAAERLAVLNLPRLRLLIRRRARRPGQRLPQFSSVRVTARLLYASPAEQFPLSKTTYQHARRSTVAQAVHYGLCRYSLGMTKEPARRYSPLARLPAAPSSQNAPSRLWVHRPWEPSRHTPSATTSSQPYCEDQVATSSWPRNWHATRASQ